jgi:hypothetical protein
MTRHSIAGTACALAVFVAAPATARATDYQLALGASAAGSEWRGDAIGYSSLKTGLRFGDIAGPYLQGRVGYGTVDERLLTLLSLGGQIWGRIGGTRPYARLAFLHQHEESMSVVAGDFGSALFGVGDGIRHRAGGELGAGLDIPLVRRDDLTLFGTVDASAKLFPDDLGPMVYAGGGLHLGMGYDL